MLACLGVAALILGLVLKGVDAKRHIGLELPNIQPNAATEEAEALASEE